MPQLSGCTDGGGSDSQPVDAGTDGSADADGEATASLTVTVFERELLTHLPLTTTTITGAQVTLDQAGSERREATSDDEGRVTFSDIDWSLGKVTLTAHRDGSYLVSRTGISEDDGDQAMWLAYANEPINAVVKGSMTGYPNGAEFAVVTSPQSNTLSETTPSEDYLLAVWPEVPFTLVGVVAKAGPPPASLRDFSAEYLGWTRIDHGPATGMTTIDIDFSNPQNMLTPTEFECTLELPTRADSPLRNESTVQVSLRVHSDTNVFFAGASEIALAADGASFDVEGQYVKIDDHGDLFTQYQLMALGNRSRVRVPGYPPDGVTVAGFLDVPQMIKPADLATPAPLHDPIEWVPPEHGVLGSITLYRLGQRVWEITAISGASVIEIPDLPSGLNADDVLGTSPLQAKIFLGTDCDPEPDVTWVSCMRSVSGLSFDLQP